MGLIKNWAWVIITVLFFCVIIGLIPRGFYDLGGDSAQYIILGESLANGSGFRMVNLPLERFSLFFLCFCGGVFSSKQRRPYQR
jgi:hypothetical protein